MMIKARQLLGLPVETQSGQHLGIISDLMIDADTGQIKKFVVNSPLLAKKVFAKELLIDETQVIGITNKKMIVSDGLAKSKELAGALA